MSNRTPDEFRRIADEVAAALRARNIPAYAGATKVAPAFVADSTAIAVLDWPQVASDLPAGAPVWADDPAPVWPQLDPALSGGLPQGDAGLIRYIFGAVDALVPSAAQDYAAVDDLGEWIGYCQSETGGPTGVILTKRSRLAADSVSGIADVIAGVVVEDRAALISGRWHATPAGEEGRMRVLDFPAEAWQLMRYTEYGLQRVRASGDPRAG